MKKAKPTQLSFLLLIMIVLLLSSCAPKNETKATLTFQATAAGPFFSGPNSLISEYEVDISAIEGLETVSKDQIKEINVSSVKVRLSETDEINFDSFSSATLQMVSPDSDMQTVAIKNPIDSNGQELALQVSEEADIVDYFKGQKLSLVLDLDFIEDSFADELSATVIMEINVKHN